MGALAAPGWPRLNERGLQRLLDQGHAVDIGRGEQAHVVKKRPADACAGLRPERFEPLRGVVREERRFLDDTAEDRAAVRGAAIGAEVLFAPGPQSVKGMGEPFRASYNDGTANQMGMFHGKAVNLGIDEVRGVMAKMDDRSLCIDPAHADAEGAESAETREHAEESAEAHGGQVSAESEGRGKGSGVRKSRRQWPRSKTLVAKA